MPVEVIFPKVDMDMESGQLSQWLCKSGDLVREGEPLFVIETDKSGMEVEASSSGTLVIGEDLSGQQVAVGHILAHIYTDGESIDPIRAELSCPSQANTSIAGSGTSDAKDRQTDLNTAHPSVNAADPSLVDHSVSGFRASPAARKLAREKGLVLQDIAGSSYRGRITKSDVLAHLAKGASPLRTQSDSIGTAAGQTGVVSHTAATNDQKLVPHSNMRRTIASRLTKSSTSIPSYQIFVDCNCASLLRIKRELQELRAFKNTSTMSADNAFAAATLNDYFIKALGLALRDHPMANSSWTDDARVVHSSVDIGIAVALDDGLITPIVRDAANQSIVEIAQITKALILRAGQGTLDKADYQGGTSTISNLGMFGTDRFTSIINPPQASILSIGRVQDSPVVIDGALSIAPVCTVSFTFDHRLIDGAEGAKLAATFKNYIENGVAMII
ncbi:MAG: dihydrolipoamide acetyltransferase family protein [Granulosicoccus sp.]